VSAPVDNTGEGWTPKLVALDVDGTLLSRSGELTPEIRASVQRVVAAGVPVVLATGRTFRTTITVATDLGLPPGFAVTQNGAVSVSYDPQHPADYEEFGRRVFDPAPVVQAVLALRPDLAIGVDRPDGYWVNRPFPAGDLSGAVTVHPLADLLSEPVTRLIVRDEAGTEDEIDHLAQQLGMHDVTYYVGYSAWLDINPRGVSKAAGLDEVCRLLGVHPGYVLAIGDGRNDIEMLQFAGRGVAVGDAPPEVRAAADAVTGRYDEQGTSAELDRWFG
jgi:hydroxymethylpyrimidine pyrophosphatase-like HAD family hydrolase